MEQQLIFFILMLLFLSNEKAHKYPILVEHPEKKKLHNYFESSSTI